MKNLNIKQIKRDENFKIKVIRELERSRIEQERSKDRKIKLDQEIGLRESELIIFHKGE